jgi:hypothetical protein
MDQNSTNDTDKRNWRERLGIGNKEMPRISGEFNKAPAVPLPERKPAVRDVQPVVIAKPAPMAPRAPSRATPTPDPQIERQHPSQAAKPMQPSSPQAPQALAEKLRSQRAAAEKLAEQRVSTARERAENANSAGQPKAVTQSPVNQAPAIQGSASQSSANRPKFSFAEEETKPEFNRDNRSLPPGRPTQRSLQPSPLQPQLTPPRPPLGGERPVAPQPPRQQMPPPAGYQPTFRPQPPQGYRPIDPATGYVPPPSMRIPNGQHANGTQPPSLGDPRLQSSRPSPDVYRRPLQDDLGYAGTGYENPSRVLPRQPALRAQPQFHEEDYGDEIFEDAPPPRSSRRASATDYNQAYRENEDAYDEGPRRSSGPWPFLLGLLLIAALVAFGGMWYYQKYIKPVSTVTSTEKAPVVPAPEQSAKVAPEKALATDPAAGEATSPSKKQIYDRIIGDKEILGGQVVPTEEIPVQPEAQQGSSQQIPQPAGTSGAQNAGEEALPLPMPPPPGSTNDTQGAIPAPISNQTVAAATPDVKSNTTEITAASNNTNVVPAPDENEGAANSSQATPPSDVAPAKEEIVTEAPVVKKKAVSKAKAKTNTEALGAEPVILVPPSDSLEPGENAASQTATTQPVVTPPAPVVKKKKTLLGLFNGTNDDVPEAQTVTPAAPAQEVASLPEPVPETAPEKKAAAAQSASGGAGYYVQLASFKSQAEASSEFGRMKSKHASIIGDLPSVINPASVGGSTRYRLAVGPLSSREQAANICSSLVAAGERDCLVRRQ